MRTHSEDIGARGTIVFGGSNISRPSFLSEAGITIGMRAIGRQAPGFRGCRQSGLGNDECDWRAFRLPFEVTGVLRGMDQLVLLVHETVELLKESADVEPESRHYLFSPLGGAIGLSLDRHLRNFPFGGQYVAWVRRSTVCTRQTAII